jgi:hypothetical protein
MTESDAEWMRQEAPASHKIRHFREQSCCDMTVGDAELDDVEYSNIGLPRGTTFSCSDGR